MYTTLFLPAAAAGTLVAMRSNTWTMADLLKDLSALLFIMLAYKATYKIWIYPNYTSPLRHLPGPRDHHFLVGQILNQFTSGSPNEPYLSWMRKWPDAKMIRYFSLGNSEALLITGLDPLREILSAKTYSFVKPSVFAKLVRPIVGKGLLFAEGEEHKTQRKQLAGSFSLSNLKKLMPGFRQKAQKLSAYFDKQISTAEGIVELVSTYSSLTLDIIGVAALGVDLENLDTPTPFHECYHQMFDPPPLGQVLLALNAFVPVQWIPLEANRQFKRARDTVRGLLLGIIRQRIQDVSTGSKEKSPDDSDSQRSRDLLTHMIEETYATDAPWTEEEILGHMLNLVAAGHETAASTLQWATHAMVKYPDVQEQLRAEVLDLLERSPEPDYAEIEGLGCINNFYKEVLRVWCPAISTPRQPVQDVLIDGVLIPRGTTVTIMPAVIHLNPQIWGDDAGQFRPDRWVQQQGPQGSSAPVDPHAFDPFSQGPRQCLGRVWAGLEIKMVLIEMLSKFRFVRAGGAEKTRDGDDEEPVVLINPSPLLRPKGGMKVRVERL